jgi:ubiquitin-activating enzyme E1
MDIDATEVVDEGLYSRQLYVMGFEAQRRLGAADVLLYGMNGLGAETAKNIILAGVRRVDLLDDRPVTYADLSSHFYCTEADVGRPRAVVSAPKLADLNPHVAVTVVTGPLTEELISRYTIVVIIDLPSEEDAIKIADFCHDRGIAVITADAPGVFGRVFCDFGDSFTVQDIDGEAAVSGVVASVTPLASSDGEGGSAGVVRLLLHAPEDTRHQLASGDVVELSGFQPQQTGGSSSSTPLSRLLQRLNGHRVPIVVRDANCFEIDVQDEDALLVATSAAAGTNSSSTNNIVSALVTMGGYFKQVGGLPSRTRASR